MKASKGSTRSPDPRPARTRASILAAIERLGAAGHDLSVAGIVAEAHLSRSSFYSQFKDLGDVAVQLVRDLYDRLEQQDEEHRPVGSAEQDIRESTEILIQEFENRRKLFAAVLGNDAVVSSQWEVCDIIAKGAMRSVGHLVPKSVDPDFATRFIAAGVLSSLIDWIRSDTPVDKDVLLDQLVDMFPDWVTA